MYVNSLKYYVKVKCNGSEFFKVKSGVKQGCVMSPWVFKVCLNGVMKRVEMK